MDKLIRNKGRIIFYSKYDLTCINNLKLSEPYILDYKKLNFNLFNLNDILELFQIKQLIDNCPPYPISWEKNLIAKSRIAVNFFWAEIHKHFAKINDDNIIENIKLIDFEYNSDFWKIFELSKSYKNV